MAKATVEHSQSIAPSIPAGLVNLAARYPQYDAGFDGRDTKKNYGKKGAVIHGYLLGILSMPQTIQDPETGEFKAWDALCFELIEPCPIKVQDPENPDRQIEGTAAVGDRIIMSMTSAVDSLRERGLQTLLDNLDDKQIITECYIVPQVSKTKAGRALWIFPVFAVGNPVKRESRHVVSLPAARRVPQLAAAPAAMPNHRPFVEAPNGQG